MKKILFTTHHLINYAGSELVIFDLAKEFRNLSYEVTIATFIYGYPIKSLFEDAQLKVVNVLESALDTKNYDIIWAQHAPVLYHVLFEQGVVAENIVSSSLSPYEPLETPPLFANELSLCLANSEENRKELLSLGVREEITRVFLNSVPDRYFDYYDPDKKGKLKKIMVVSNHVPEEIHEAAALLEQKDITVDIFGIENKFEVITPEKMLQYDAVVTIGRTVQQALSAGVPVYCYDRFGGPGWITRENLDKAEFYNFSGRCTHRKVNGDIIAQEIFQQFADVFVNRAYFYPVAKERYSLSKNVLEVIQVLDGSHLSIDHILSGNGSLKRHNQYYVRELKNKALEAEILKDRINQLGELLRQKEEVLCNIHNSKSWRLIKAYYKLKDILLRK